jgi:D-3-phosphoglycerate dehydrogenase
MDTIRVVVTDYIEPDLDWEKSQLSKFPEIEFHSYQLQQNSSEEAISKIRDVDVLVVNMYPMDRAILQRLRKCKLIIRHGTGHGNVDVNACTELGITLANVPDYCAEEVAEHTLFLIFACARKIYAQRKILIDSIKKGEWDFSDLYPVFKIKGKTLGIIGCGKIGYNLLNMARGLGMNVRVYDPYLSEEIKNELAIEHEDFNTIISESDIISIHCDLNNETKNLFGYEQFKMMKPSAYFINTAMGEIVKTEDLIQALEDKLIAGAGIDVYAGKEPPSIESPLLNIENIILSPHIGWYSEESGWSIRVKIVDEIIRFYDNEEPRFILNK